MPFSQRPANLRPLPMRITQRQYDRLVAHRERDSIALQEHIRRALDNYLDLLDRKASREDERSPPSAEDGVPSALPDRMQPPLKLGVKPLSSTQKLPPSQLDRRADKPKLTLR
jgi:hypothetical protein